MRRLVVLIIVASSLAALALTSAASASAAQRIDMKVLLLGTSTTEPDFVSWQSALQREGVPFEAIVTSPGHSPITAATLSDTLANGTAEAKYQAVIVSVGGLPECTTTCVSTLAQSEWTALEEYEHAFSVRQLTGDIYPSSTYGLNSPTVSGALDGAQGTLTTEGKAVFPYLKESVAMDTGTYGYEATPLATQVTGASFQTLVTGPSSSALVGVYTRSNGTQEMVETFDQNQYQLQAELLRHGALNWVTRGVYFGDQRNYVEMDIDDTFTPDDSWDTTTHEINYDNADALRMQPVDVDYAAKWEKEHGGFRMEQLFNGGGSVEYQANNGGTDPVLAEFQKEDPETKKSYADSFGWLSHTYDTPYMDVGCATQNYIEAELNENSEWAAAKPGATPGTGGLGLTESSEPTVALGAENPKVFVPGNHSGFADLVPGNPATVDAPELDSDALTEGGKGTLAAGSYQYAITDQFAEGAGQSAADVTEPLAVPADGSVTLEWESICHAADYLIYREVAGSNKWSLIGTVKTPFSAILPDNSVGEATSTTNVTGGGESQQTLVDTGAAGAAEPAGWTPPIAENAVESPWEQNPYFIPALEAVGITAVGDDASKAYPDPPEAQFGIGTTYTGREYAAGETFLDGTAQVVPRHPINIYYNASTEAQEVDEWNTLFEPPSAGGQCQPTSTTTCETAPATFAEIVKSVVSGMFQNMMGNDPRPSYVHQTNIIGHPPAGEPTNSTPLPKTPEKTGDGLLYSVLNPLLSEYNKYFASTAPYEQLTLGAIAKVLAEQAAWTAALSAGTVSGYIEGNQITINNSGSSAVNAPLTGVTGVGTPYGGVTSGWASVPVATSTHSAPTTWPVGPPSITTTSLPEGRVHAGYAQTISASGGATPYAWSLSSGSLPAGLSLNATSGAITGTPSGTGSSNFTVKLTDSSTPTAQTVTANLSITVLANPPASVSQPASAVLQGSAILSATVNPSGAEVSKCEFEYGTTNSYGQTAACSSLPGSGENPVTVSAALTSLAANTTYHFRISATNAGGTSKGSDETFKTPPNAPTVVSEKASLVTQTAATLNATTNPNGGEVTKCELEYGTTNSYGKTAACAPAPGSASNPVAVSASLTGLTANTTYHFRISATNAGGTSRGSDETLRTLPNAPTVVSEKASVAQTTTATLNAAVNPNGGEVSKCEFEYGTTTSYGQSAACSSLPGSAESPVAVSAALTGLAANTTYHFRISATNAGGTSKAADETLTTLPSLTITAAALPNGYLGTPYTQTLAASGGVTPYSWAISAGSLPAGLSLNGETGAITGTPSAAGTQSFTIKVTDSSTPSAQSASASLSITVVEPTYATSITSYEMGFKEPNAVAVDPSGDIFAADPGHERIVEFNSERKYLRQFGEEGSGPGQFKGIGGIAANAAGDLYVSDSGNNRVEEFGPSGEFLRSFGTPVLASGQLLYPGAIAIDSEGNVWVLNPYGGEAAGHIVEFSSTGTYLSKFGSSGSGEGQLGIAYGLAFSGGHLYVSELSNSRVQEFSTKGEYLGSFDPLGSGTGKSTEPWGIASDSSGNLYVSELGADRVQEFSSAGAFIAAFGSEGAGPGQLQSPRGVAVGPAGNIFIADSANNRIENWAPGSPPTYATSITSYEMGFKEPNAVAVDPSGDIFAADPGHERIVEFNSERKYLRQFGEEGSGPGQFKGIGGIAANAAGDLYVSDSGNNRVEEFGPSGEFLRSFGTPVLASGQLLYPGAIAIDSEGNVWVLNPYGGEAAGHIVEFSSTGTYLSKFGSSGSGEGQLGIAYGLAFSGGHLYVSELSNSRVQEFSTKGEYLGSFDPLGSGTGKSTEPWGIASDSSGNLYVSELGADRVQEFSSAGAFIAAFGSEGAGPGQLQSPRGVAVGPAGNIFIADSANNRIENWAP